MHRDDIDFFFFFFNDPATTEIYPLPHPAPLPISRPWPLLAAFTQYLAADPRSRSESAAGPRLLLADDPPLPQLISQHVAGERSFDVMHIGVATEIGRAHV